MKNFTKDNYYGYIFKNNLIKNVKTPLGGNEHAKYRK